MARVGTRGAGLSKDIALSVKNRLTHLGANVSDDLARLSGKVEDAFAYADGAVSKNIGKHNARFYQSNGGNWDEVASGILGSSGAGRKAAAEFSDDASQALARHGDEVSRALKETGEQAGKKVGQEFSQETSEQLAKHSDDVAKGAKEAGEGLNKTEIPETEPRFGERKISQEEYNGLRSETPTQEIRDMVNDGVTLPMNDPVIPGNEITKRLEADHIVSMDRITRMDGFEKLTREQQLEVLNCEDNFVGLSKSANASKGAKTYEDWTFYKKTGVPIDPAFRAEMIMKEKKLERLLQAMIDNFVKYNGG